MTEPSGVSPAQASCQLPQGSPSLPSGHLGCRLPGGQRRPPAPLKFLRSSCRGPLSVPPPPPAPPLEPLPPPGQPRALPLPCRGRTQACPSLMAWLLWAQPGDGGTRPQGCPWHPALPCTCWGPQAQVGLSARPQGQPRAHPPCNSERPPLAGPAPLASPQGWGGGSVFLPRPHQPQDNDKVTQGPGGGALPTFSVLTREPVSLSPSPLRHAELRHQPVRAQCPLSLSPSSVVTWEVCPSPDPSVRGAGMGSVWVPLLLVGGGGGRWGHSLSPDLLTPPPHSPRRMPALSPRPLRFQPCICSDIRWGLSPALACQ